MTACLRRTLFSSHGTELLQHFGRRWASGFPRIQGLESNFIARPSLVNITRLVLQGTPLPPDTPGLNIKEFMSGAHFAISRTTEILASENIEDHSDLFGNEIHGKLRARVSELDAEVRKELLVDSNDIFFSWIDGEVLSDKGGTSIKCVAMSFPKYGELRRNIKEKTEIEEELREDLKNLVSQRAGSEVIRPNLDNSEIKELNRLRASLYKSGEVIIMNALFHRGSESAPWIIKDFSMSDSESVHTHIGKRLWKFRLKVSVESQRDFLLFLRFDYFTNYLIIIGTLLPFMFLHSA